MNPAGPPGQTATGQPNAPRPGGPQPTQAPNRVLFRPEQMRTIPVLNDAEKAKYEQGLRGLWQTAQNSPRGSQAQLEAQKKIAEFSQQLVAKMRNRGIAIPGAQPSQGQQGTQGQQGQQSQQGQQGAHPATEQSTGTAENTAPAPVAPAAQPATAASGASTPAPGQAQQPGARALGITLTPQVRRHLDQMTFLAPQATVDQGPEAVAKWTTSIRERYGKAVMQMTVTVERIKALDGYIKGLQAKGSSMTSEEQQKLQEAMQSKTMASKAHTDAKTFVENFRREQTAIKEARAQLTGGAQDATAPQPARPGPSPQQLVNNTNSSVPQASPATEAAKGQPQPAGLAGRPPGANGQAGQPLPQAQAQPPAPISAPTQPSPVPSAPPAPGTAGAQVKIEPGTQQHVAPPPPVNTAIATAAAAGLPSAGTPTQNSARIQTPLTATPTTGAPRSLSHSAALTLANQSRSQPNSVPTNQTPQQGTPQGIGGTPASAGVMGTAQQPQAGHPHAHPTQIPQATLTQKLPIAKTLPEKATMPPQPVSANIGGVTPGRPTYTQGGGSTGGVMGQPVLPKIPVVQMEGEGERVLNRKKLDDLVRQVCGGQAEGQEGNGLTPDVEEVSRPIQFESNHPVLIARKRLTITSLGRSKHGRFLRRPPFARSLLQREAARFQGAGNPRHPASPGAHLQHPYPRLLFRRIAHGAKSTSCSRLDQQDERHPGVQGHWQPRFVNKKSLRGRMELAYCTF